MSAQKIASMQAALTQMVGKLPVCVNAPECNSSAIKKD